MTCLEESGSPCPCPCPPRSELGERLGFSFSGHGRGLPAVASPAGPRRGPGEKRSILFKTPRLRALVSTSGRRLRASVGVLSCTHANSAPSETRVLSVALLRSPAPSEGCSRHRPSTSQYPGDSPSRPLPSCGRGLSPEQAPPRAQG